ncbi:MAG: hypothetical protein WD114_04110 [Phycisphaerales bacterium]
MATKKSKPNPQEAPATARENRTVWWALFGLSIVAIIVAGIVLTQRIGAYYKEADHPLFAFMQVASTDFTFAGNQITVTEVVDEQGQPAVRVTYADQELLLHTVFPPKHELPSLYDRQREWFAMLFFADRSGMTLEEFERRIAQDEIPLRLAIVTRTPFGIDPAKDARFDSITREENWATGEVHRDQWRFDFYEFMRDGTIAHEAKRFPESGKNLLRRRVSAELRGEPEPQRADDEIREYTWQFGAAIKVMNRPPPITQERQALLNAGWTLPVAAAGFLMLIVSFFFAIAPQRVRE